MALQKLDMDAGIHIDDFITAFDDTPFELIDGERILLVPGIARHIEIIRTLVRMIDPFVQAHNLGELYFEAPFVLEDKPDWVRGSRVPDVMFFSRERFDEYKIETPDWQDKPFVLVPDIVVEVVSPNDSFSLINRKVMNYLRDGVAYVWVIDPQAKNAILHTKAKSIILTETDSLVADDLLPNFHLSLAELFKKIGDGLQILYIVFKTW